MRKALKVLGDIPELHDPFPCTACGACCMNVSHVPDLQAMGWVLSDGRCRHYDAKTKKCAIYTARPAVCRVDACKPPLMAPQSWRQLNLSCCDWMHRIVYEEEREQTGICTHTQKAEIAQVVDANGRVAAVPKLPDEDFEIDDAPPIEPLPDPPITAEDIANLPGLKKCVECGHTIGHRSGCTGSMR